jgi:hypothetical protein
MKKIILITGVIFCLITAHASFGVIVDLASNTSVTINAGSGQITTFSIDNTQPSGTGIFNTFLRVHNKGTEKGYNTDGEFEFNTMNSHQHTHSLKVSDLTLVNGSFEFLLDVAESQSKDNALLSLDVLKIFLADSGNLDDYAAGLGDMVFDLGNNWVKIDSKPGNGKADVKVTIQNDPAWSSDKYVYLYCEFGKNYSSCGSFEEWKANTTITPEPATLGLFGLGALMLRKRK